MLSWSERQHLPFATEVLTVSFSYWRSHGFARILHAPGELIMCLHAVPAHIEGAGRVIAFVGLCRGLSVFTHLHAVPARFEG